MADSKVSELTSATSAGGSDQLYLVQSNTSKKITVGTLMSTAGNITLSGNITVGGTPQALGAGGFVSLVTPITYIVAGATNQQLLITKGTTGQVKYIVMSSTGGGAFTLGSSNIAGGGTISFDSAGDTATLLFIENNWFMVGGTANVTY